MRIALPLPSLPTSASASPVTPEKLVTAPLQALKLSRALPVSAGSGLPKGAPASKRHVAGRTGWSCSRIVAAWVALGTTV